MAKGVSTTGLHAREILGDLYRYGTLTQQQLRRRTGISESGIKRQLGHLVAAGYVARANDVAGWQRTSTGRPRTAYYLTSPLGSKTAAFALGIENDYLALRHYRRVRLPGTVSHRLLGNEYLLTVQEAAVAAGMEVEEVFAESCPSFPIFGSGVPKTDRADSPYRFTRIVSDGTWTLSGHTFLLECETGTHARKELVSKLNDYGGRWRRMLKPNLGERKFHNLKAHPEPVIILTPTSAHKKMRDYLMDHLPDAEDFAAADEAIRAATPETDDDGKVQKHKSGKIKALAYPLQLILVASIDEVRDDPLGRCYRPLRKYPTELSDGTGWRVSLSDAAAISARIPIPKKPPGTVEALDGTEDVAS